MRKLISKREEEKRRKRNQFIVGGVLIFLMLFATLGYAFQSWTGDNSNQGNPVTINYNGFEFTDIGGFWTLSTGGTSYVFRHNPDQVQEIPSVVNSLASYSNGTLRVYSENVLAEGEIRANLNSHVRGTEKLENISDLDCTGEINAIIIRHGETGIRQEGGCVHVTGPENEIIKITDEFLFRVLGIRQ